MPAALNAIVRTNIAAVNAHRQLSGASRKQTSAAEQLASGKRINSAADDAAGMGIAQKMRAQIVSLDRASMNAQDGMSLVQTAEGALDSIGDMLIRARELIIQASNDTNVHDPSFIQQSDRRAIQDELDQLMMEINNIAHRTEFNTRTLLDGGLHQEGVVHGNVQSFDVVQINSPPQIQTLDQFLRFPANRPFVGSFEELLIAIGADFQSMSASDWIAIHGSNAEGLETALDIAMGVDPVVAGTGAVGLGRWNQLETASGLSFGSAREVLDAFVQGLHNPNALQSVNTNWNDDPIPFLDWDDFLQHSNHSMGASTFARAVSTSGGQTIYQALRLATPSFGGLTPNSTFSEVRNVFYTMGGEHGGWGAGLTDDIADALTSAGWLDTRGMSWPEFAQTYLTADTEIVQEERWVADERTRERGVALWLQIGANSGQGIHVGIRSMTTRSLGDPVGDLVDLIDVENVSGRPISDQVDYVDHALNRVNQQRAELGVVHNRLEFAQMGLDISSENLSAAMSRIRDADMAKAMMDFYAANALTQAATAMIAMANQSPQSVLELLQ